MSKQTNERIETLRQRERDIRAALASEQMKLAKRQKRETARLESIVGSILLKAAGSSSGLTTLLKQTLENGCTSESERNFLKAHRWL
jgi:hypothetical protein